MAKSISVSMPDFTIVLRENGALVRTIDDCGFGRAEHEVGEDPRANMTVNVDAGSLSSDQRELCHWSKKYSAHMPYALFFDGSGCAFHWGSTFAQSHGCVHLSERDAKALFDWAGDDPVSLDVTGDHPLPGVRIYRVDSTNMLPAMVLAINEALAGAGYLTRPPDTTYNDETAAAVRAFQGDRGLEPIDGWVGADTAAELGVAPRPHHIGPPHVAD